MKTSVSPDPTQIITYSLNPLLGSYANYYLFFKSYTTGYPTQIITYSLNPTLLGILRKLLHIL